MTSNPIVTLFYRRLLDLDLSREPGPQLEDALRLLVQVSTASGGYLELHGEKEPRFSRAVGLDANALVQVREAISHGIIAHAMASGRGLDLSPIARALPAELALNRVAISCSPIGCDDPIGIVYLQRPQRSFSVTDIQYARLFALRIEPLCAVLLPRTLDERVSAFKRLLIRQELKRHGWNKTTTARSLGVGRAALYRAMQRK